jgi:hypothetical protein
MAGTLNLTITRGVTYGPILISCKDAQGDPVPLAGWTAFAEMRKKPAPASAVVLDFAPVIAADDAAGLVTIPRLSHADTAALPPGVFGWDLILQDAAGIRYEPTLAGTCTISAINTAPAATPPA